MRHFQPGIVRNPHTVTAIVIALFVAIFALRMVTYTANDGIGLLYSVPIALAAVRFGPIVGLAAAVTAFGLFCWYVQHNPEHVVLIDGYLSRLVTYVCIGVVLGYIARMREHANELDRQRTRRMFLDLQHVRDQERRAISSDLHDFVLQQVMVSLMRLEEVRDSLAPNPQDTASLDAAEELLRNSLGSLRSIIDGLQPLDLDHVELTAVVRATLEELSRDYGVPIEFFADEAVPSIDPTIKLLIYRAIVEAARNAAKYGGGTTVRVNFQLRQREVVAQVLDSGPGFDVDIDVKNTAVPGIGAGFSVLLEQLLESGGGYSVRSSQEDGTAVELRMPLGATEAIGIPINR
jgi:signal transduction histidine kinase